MHVVCCVQQVNRIVSFTAVHSVRFPIVDGIGARECGCCVDDEELHIGCARQQLIAHLVNLESKPHSVYLMRQQEIVVADEYPHGERNPGALVLIFQHAYRAVQTHEGPACNRPYDAALTHAAVDAMPDIGAFPGFRGDLVDLKEGNGATRRHDCEGESGGKPRHPFLDRRSANGQFLYLATNGRKTIRPVQIEQNMP